MLSIPTPEMRPSVSLLLTLGLSLCLGINAVSHLPSDVVPPQNRQYGISLKYISPFLISLSILSLSLHS